MTQADDGDAPGSRVPRWSLPRARRRGHRRVWPWWSPAAGPRRRRTPRWWPTRTSCRSPLPATCRRPASTPQAVPPALAPSWLSIPSIGVHDLRVVAYLGSPDDAAGTVIEDRGVAASPRGRRGGGAPGTVGNFIVTGHRTAAGAPLGRLPELQAGAHVLVRSGSAVYDYVVTGTMSVSFRSRALHGLADRCRTRAPRPGRDPADGHAVDLRDTRGPCGRRLVARRARQPGAPDRQGGRARRRPAGVTHGTCGGRTTGSAGCVPTA